MQVGPLGIILALIGLATLVMKTGVPVFGRHWTIPPALEGALDLVTPVVLSALAAPALFLPDGPPLQPMLNNRLLAGAIAVLLALVSLRLRPLVRLALLITIGGGMISLWMLQLR